MKEQYKYQLYDSYGPLDEPLVAESLNHFCYKMFKERQQDIRVIYSFHMFGAVSKWSHEPMLRCTNIFGIKWEQL